MSGRKRGHYFKYLQRVENEPLAKIPRQTEWNRKRKAFYNINSVEIPFYILKLERVLLEEVPVNSHLII